MTKRYEVVVWWNENDVSISHCDTLAEAQKIAKRVTNGKTWHDAYIRMFSAEGTVDEFVTDYDIK